MKVGSELLKSFATMAGPKVRRDGKVMSLVISPNFVENLDIKKLDKILFYQNEIESSFQLLVSLHSKNQQSFVRKQIGDFFVILPLNFMQID